MQQVADSAYTILVSKLKVEKLKEPNNNAWPYNLGVVNEYTEKYQKAIDFYKEAMEKKPLLSLLSVLPHAILKLVIMIRL